MDFVVQLSEQEQSVMSLPQSTLWSLLDVRTVLLCLSVLLVLHWFFRRPKNLPPGPWGFPIIGSIPAILRDMRGGVLLHEIFMRYAAKYGPVFSLKILNKTVVVLNDYASVKEAFQHPQLNDRPKLLITELFKSEGRPWYRMREPLRFVQKNSQNSIVMA